MIQIEMQSPCDVTCESIQEHVCQLTAASLAAGPQNQ